MAAQPGSNNRRSMVAPNSRLTVRAATPCQTDSVSHERRRRIRAQARTMGNAESPARADCGVFRLQASPGDRGSPRAWPCDHRGSIAGDYAKGTEGSDKRLVPPMGRRRLTLMAAVGRPAYFRAKLTSDGAALSQTPDKVKIWRLGRIIGFGLSAVERSKTSRFARQSRLEPKVQFFLIVNATSRDRDVQMRLPAPIPKFASNRGDRG